LVDRRTIADILTQCRREKTPIAELTVAERAAVASLIREHLRTTRSVLADLGPLKSAYAKLAPADDPPPTPRIGVRPVGLTPSRRR
jgi:hypothetical protein